MAAKTEDTTTAPKDAPKADAKTEAPADAAEAEGTEGGKLEEAMDMVKRFSYWGIGASAIPVVALDTAVLLGVQLRMVHKLSGHYGVEFKENVVKSVVTSVVGSMGAGVVGHNVLGRLVGAIPTVGPVLKLAAAPVVGGAFTYAVGKMFAEHFESGGTLLTLDTAKAKLGISKNLEEASETDADADAEKKAA